MAFLLKAIGLTDSVPGFPYTPRGNSAGSTTAAAPTLTWTMRPGVSSEDGRPVTIFSISLAKADNAVKELAQHAMKRAKSLLLPGLLRCHGAAEHQGTVYIATEPCEPLSHVLLRSSSHSRSEEDNESDDDDESFLEGAALGLKAVGSALTALHRNNFVHGNVSCDSVYVLPSGEWRLFGLELVSAFDDSYSIYQRYASLLPEYRRPPETLQANYETSVHVSNTDSWGMACLIYEVLGVPKTQTRSDLATTCRTNDLRGCRSLPRTLQSGFIGLCVANLKMRHSVERFLSSSEFIVGSEFVQCMQALEELSLKDTLQREQFFEHLSSVVDAFPKKTCMTLVLPKIQASFNFGVLSAAIDPIMKIAARITAPEDYAAHVAPVIVSLFASQDRMVRYQLLQRASEYAPLLPRTVVNEQVWPLFVSGFSNTVPSIREYSARALVSFAGSLNEKTIRNDVCRYITQLQQDAEGAIRTNATISLCFMADVIPEDIRSKTLIHGFGRMLKDPFVPSRVGALRSLHTSMRHLTPQHIAERMFSEVGPLTADGVAEVRQVALNVMRGALDRLVVYDAEVSAKTAKLDADAAMPAAAQTDTACDGDKRSGFSKWGWWWGATTPTTTTTTLTTSSAGIEAPEVASSGVTAAGAVKDPHESTFTTTTRTTTSATTPVTAPWVNHNNNVADTGGDTTFSGTSLSATSSAADNPPARHVEPDKAKESATENRAMKLRKKGLGASRLA